MEMLKHQGFNTIILILSGISIAYIVFPLASILTFGEPTKLLDYLTRPELWDAFVLSLISASISTSTSSSLRNTSSVFPSKIY